MVKEFEELIKSARQSSYPDEAGKAKNYKRRHGRNIY